MYIYKQERLNSTCHLQAFRGYRLRFQVHIKTNIKLFAKNS